MEPLATHPFGLVVAEVLEVQDLRKTEEQE
jgi:hypothetical protein